VRVGVVHSPISYQQSLLQGAKLLDPASPLEDLEEALPSRVSVHLVL
jgi:hypothetical protein